MWSNRKQKTKNEASFRVNSLQDLTNCIIPLFSNYPLLSPLVLIFNTIRILACLFTLMPVVNTTERVLALSYAEWP
jgi:hypothetical protein